MRSVMTSSSPSSRAREGSPRGKKLLSFSIDYILDEAGGSGRRDDVANESPCAFLHFPWLNCTRYYPPKVPRSQQKKETYQKRQSGRHPRIPFTRHQLATLEAKFKERPYLSNQEVTEMSRSLELADVRVKIWFQNRRARERRELSLRNENNGVRSTTSSHGSGATFSQNLDHFEGSPPHATEHPNNMVDTSA